MGLVVFSSGAVSVAPSEPFSFDLTELCQYGAAFQKGDDASTRYQKLGLYKDLPLYLSGDEGERLEQIVAFSGTTSTATNTFHFSKRVYVDKLTFVFACPEALNSSYISYSVAYVTGDFGSPQSYSSTVFIDGKTVVCETTISKFFDYLKFGLFVGFNSALPFADLTLTSVQLSLAGSGAEGVSVEVVDAPVSDSTETTPSFVAPPVTVPDFSAVTESPSPVDGWLQPAHGGVGGAINPAESALSDEAFSDGASWLDVVVTFLVSQPLVAPFFALGCGLLITRVAFGGK